MSAIEPDLIAVRVCDPTSPDARFCLESYYAELSRRFEKGFDVKLSADPDAKDMIAPRGVFLVAYYEDKAIGCVGLKGTDKGYGEVKRLWVDAAARGAGLAKRLMALTEGHAKDLGIDVLRLDTNRALPEAIAMYRKSGWSEIDRYNDDPYPDFFFEKHLYI